MKVECTHCKARFSAPDEYLGKKARCPKCKEVCVLIEVQADTPAAPQQYEERESRRKTVTRTAQSVRVPDKFRQYMHEDEVVLFASNPAKTVLVLNLVLPVLFLLGSIPATIFMRSIGSFVCFFFFCFVCLFIYLAWKNRFYIITDKRTFAVEGIFNIAVSLIPNKSIQMICINTGIIDRLLGLNTLEISSAAQGGTNIFHAFAGKSRGTIKLRCISDVNGALAVYHEVFG